MLILALCMLLMQQMRWASRPCHAWLSACKGLNFKSHIHKPLPTHGRAINKMRTVHYGPALLWQAGSQSAVRVAGGGPERIDAGDTAALFAFDSGGKTFTRSPALAFSTRTAGMALQA